MLTTLTDMGLVRLQLLYGCQYIQNDLLPPSLSSCSASNTGPVVGWLPTASLRLASNHMKAVIYEERHTVLNYNVCAIVEPLDHWLVLCPGI